MNASTTVPPPRKVSRRLAPSNAGAVAIEFFFWASAGLVLFFMGILRLDDDRDGLTAASSALSLALGLRIFLSHGRHAITVNGLFSLSLAMFVGFSGLYIPAFSYPAADSIYVFQAILGGYLMQVIVGFLAWGSQRRYPRATIRRVYAPVSLMNKFVIVGFIVFIGAIGINSLAGETTISESMAFTAICASTVGLLWRQNARLFGLSSALILTMLGLYAFILHSGQGRLRIVALFCAIGTLYSVRFLRPWIKPLIVVGLPVAIAWLAAIRLSLQESLATGASVGRTGLESMVAPLAVFSQLIEAADHGLVTPVYGTSFLSILSVLIPSSVWPDAPKPLGYELVAITDPLKYDSGFSTVATSAGEAYYNFGWAGIPIVSVVVALLIRWGDRTLARLTMSPSVSSAGFWILVTLVLTSSVADYAWSGVHTYVARSALRLPVVAIFGAVTWMAVRKKSHWG